MEGVQLAGLALITGVIAGYLLRPAKKNNSHYKLNQIIMALSDLKAEVEGLKQDVATLQGSVDAEQAQIAALLEQNAAVVTDLNTQIATLEAQLAEAQDPTVLQEAIDGLKEIRQSIVTAKEDIGGTVADAEQPEQPETPTV